jgi:uncharacterized repeat protein (TIGR01451 family)
MILDAGSASDAQMFSFQIPNVNNFTLPVGEVLTLRLTNETASDSPSGAVILHSLLDDVVSNVALNAITVINVDSVLFYADAARTVLLPSTPETPGPTRPNRIEAGETLYIQAVVSDPFGAVDITGALLTLIDPNLAEQRTNVAMTAVVNVAANKKTFNYDYVVPGSTSIPLGPWAAEVTALEGTEGTVMHTDANGFNTIASPISATYTVAPLSAFAGDTLTYTIIITKPSTGSSSVYIEDLLPTETTTLSMVTANGSINGSDPERLDNVTISQGNTTITYTVVVDSGALAGDLINNTISVFNTSSTVLAAAVIAPSVLIDPFALMPGNKLIYADSLAGSPTLDRTLPTIATKTTRSVSSQGGSTTLVLAPVLATNLTLAPGVVKAGIWVSRGSSFAGLRTIQANLGYIGASTGSIGVTATQTIQLQEGTVGAQYLPFSFTLAGPNRTILANTSFTLTITNTTTVAGETIILHSFKDDIHPSQVALNTLEPITIPVINFFDDNANEPGAMITEAGQGTDIWVVATVQDAFGAADVTAANLTITDAAPSPTVTLNDQVMTLSPVQPGVPGQKNFQFKHTLSSKLGAWSIQVVAKEGFENTMTATATQSLTVNNFVADLSDSDKSVINVTTGDIDNTNAGDVLRYTITLTENGGVAASNLAITDTFDANLTYVPNSLLIDGVAPAVTPASLPSALNLSGLPLSARSTLAIQYDMQINSPIALGTHLTNVATATSDSAVTQELEAEDAIISGLPAAGFKQLYLNDVGVTGDLTRSTVGIVGQGIELIRNANSATFDLDLVGGTRRAMDIEAGSIDVKLLLEPTGNNLAQNRTVRLRLIVTDSGSAELLNLVNRVNKTLSPGVATLETFTLTNPSLVNVPVGSSIQLMVESRRDNARNFILSQKAGPLAPYTDYSQVVLPTVGSIEVTDLKFFGKSALDNGGTAGCEVTFSCALEIAPGVLSTGPYSVWLQATIADAFGADDINSDCGVDPEKCPAILLTDSGGVDQTANPAFLTTYINTSTTNLTYLGPSPASPADSGLYEIEIQAPGVVAGLEGDWSIIVNASEGREELIVDAGVASYEVVGQPALTIVKTVSGTYNPSDVVAYTNIVTNTGYGPATQVVLTNEIAPFLTLELIKPGTEWTAVDSLTGSYSVESVSFDDTIPPATPPLIFIYDPNTTGPCSVVTPPVPCYDPAIRQWRIKLVENIPVSEVVTETYKARID